MPPHMEFMGQSALVEQALVQRMPLALKLTQSMVVQSLFMVHVAPNAPPPMPDAELEALPEVELLAEVELLVELLLDAELLAAPPWPPPEVELWLEAPPPPPPPPPPPHATNPTTMNENPAIQRIFASIPKWGAMSVRGIRSVVTIL